MVLDLACSAGASSRTASEASEKARQTTSTGSVAACTASLECCQQVRKTAATNSGVGTCISTSTRARSAAKETAQDVAETLRGSCLAAGLESVFSPLVLSFALALALSTCGSSLVGSSTAAYELSSALVLALALALAFASCGSGLVCGGSTAYELSSTLVLALVLALTLALSGCDSRLVCCCAATHELGSVACGAFLAL